MRETLTICGKVYTPGEDDNPDVAHAGVKVRLGRGGSEVACYLTDAGGNFVFTEQPWKTGFQLAVDGLDVEAETELDPDGDGVFNPTGPGKAVVNFTVSV